MISKKSESVLDVKASSYQMEDKKTICLNMIVKNESDIICRCLGSLKWLIDYWVIVDTGSTDGTQNIIKEFMIDVPGELHERPWINFAHNRNESLQLAKSKCDYVLVIDADESLVFAKDFQLPKLDKDYYQIISLNSGTIYPRVQLINSKLNWQWIGVLHEGLFCPQAKSFGELPSVINQIFWDGNRSKDPLKYKKDADVLEAALKKEPVNSRYVFYLAQSYRDCGEKQAALKNYQKRVVMGGSHEEVFWSLNEAAKLKDQLMMPFDGRIPIFWVAA